MTFRTLETSYTIELRLKLAKTLLLKLLFAGRKGF
jgi:hypothetical protein